MEAVRRAVPGQTIRLAPGRYYEQVRLDKNVRIVGPREAVLVWDKGPTILCKGPVSPRVEGITVRNSEKHDTPSADFSAVSITDGSRAIFESCNISSLCGNGVDVKGANTEPVLRWNVVHYCGLYGVRCVRAAGIIEVIIT
eukprot:tig00020875_g14900.t1